MDITLNTPALLFPAISLLMLAYTNRFLGLANLIRNLHAANKVQAQPALIQQITNLRHRIYLIRNMQALGVLSLLLCTVSMLFLFLGWILAGKIFFFLSLSLMMGSLALSIREIQISVQALELHLQDMEKN